MKKIEIEVNGNSLETFDDIADAIGLLYAKCTEMREAAMFDKENYGPKFVDTVAVIEYYLHTASRLSQDIRYYKNIEDDQQ